MLKVLSEITKFFKQCACKHPNTRTQKYSYLTGTYEKVCTDCDFTESVVITDGDGNRCLCDKYTFWY